MFRVLWTESLWIYCHIHLYGVWTSIYHQNCKIANIQNSNRLRIRCAIEVPDSKFRRHRRAVISMFECGGRSSNIRTKRAKSIGAMANITITAEDTDTTTTGTTTTPIIIDEEPFEKLKESERDSTRTDPLLTHKWVAIDFVWNRFFINFFWSHSIYHFLQRFEAIFEL